MGAVPTLTESDLACEIPAEFAWRRYDAHPYYQLLAGRCLAGVDFVLLAPRGERAYLVEVKNYRVRFGAAAPAKLPKYARRPNALAEVLARKAIDTREGLRLIDRHYRRRWYWPALGWAIGRGGFAETDAAFFTRAYAARSHHLCVVATDEAYAELPGFDAAAWRAAVERELRGLVGGECRVIGGAASTYLIPPPAR